MYPHSTGRRSCLHHKQWALWPGHGGQPVLPRISKVSKKQFTVVNCSQTLLKTFCLCKRPPRHMMLSCLTFPEKLMLSVVKSTFRERIIKHTTELHPPFQWIKTKSNKAQLERKFAFLKSLSMDQQVANNAALALFMTETSEWDYLVEINLHLSLNLRCSIAPKMSHSCHVSILCPFYAIKAQNGNGMKYVRIKGKCSQFSNGGNFEESMTSYA